MDCGRFRFESSGPSDGPSLLPNQTKEAQPVTPQNLTSPFHESEPTQHDTSLIATQTSNPLDRVGTLTLGPGPPSSPSPITPYSQDNNLNSSTNTNSDEEIISCTKCSRKRIRLDIGRLGRNIRQRLCCGHFQRSSYQDEEDNIQTVQASTSKVQNVQASTSGNFMETESKDRLREAGLHQLPQQP